jgi:ankyrin repeat protein
LRVIGEFMHGGSMKQLPPSPNISHLKKQAKELLRAYKRNEPEALSAFAGFLPSARRLSAEKIARRDLRLHDAQSCIAREYGFRSWSELKAYANWHAAGKQDLEGVRKRWLSLVYGEGYSDPRPRLAARLVRERPDIIGSDAYFASAAGDEAVVRDALDKDAGWLSRAGGPLNMPPLIAVTHSGLVREESFSAGLTNCARLLLERGADPNQTWINPRLPDSPLSAVYGAAGKNHHAGMTRLLLEHGANPNDNESLYHSVECGDLTCTRLLLEAGAKVDGTNAIGRVLDYDRIEGLKLLLQYKGNAGHRGASEFPLFHAIRRGRSVEHVRLLLESGADPTRKNSAGLTPYRFALYYGQPEIAAILPRDTEDVALSVEDQFVAACTCCDRETASRILAGDPRILGRLTKRHLRQLPNMAAQANLRAVKFMVEIGWPIDVTGGDWGASALNLAVYRGQAEMTEFLLRHGASWEEKHSFGDNAMGTLSFASRAENIEANSGDWIGCAKVLVAHGMPLPPERYEFSEEVTEYFESLREGS